MISNHELKSRIVEKIIGFLESLYVYGFSKPIVIQDDWSTSITLMLEAIGIEIEIDWRDFEIFVLVVRLENGNLPDGYYISKGQPCRYHLQKVISDRKWKVDQDALAKISPGKKNKQLNSMHSESIMLDRFYFYKKVIDSCIDRLVEESDMIFNN